MKHLLAIAILALLSCACSTTKPQPAVVTVQDSVRTETRYEFVERIDTVLIVLPQQTVERIVVDTTSTLENAYAKTTATILPNGVLFHNLITKQTPVPVPTKNTIFRYDSVAYQVKETPVPYPVEVEVCRLTFWQQAQIYGFRALIVFLAITAAIRYRKKILNLVRRFI